MDHACWHRPGTPTISLASVLVVNTTSTDEGIIQLESLAKPGLPQTLLAVIVVYHWQVNLLQNYLVLASSSKLVLTPPSGKAGLCVKDLCRVWKTDCVYVLLQLEGLISIEDSPIIGKISGTELRMDVKSRDVSVLVRSGLCLVLCVPLSTPDLQLLWLLLKLGHTVSSSKDDPGGNQRATTLVQVHCLRFPSIPWVLDHWFLSQDSTHVGPLPKLGLALNEALDPDTQTILMSLATLGDVLHHRLWGRGHKVRVKAADIQEARALAVLGAEDPEPIPDVNEAPAISDDGAIVALVVGDTLIALGLSVVSTVLKHIVHSGCGLVCQSSLCGLVVIRGHVAIFILDHLDNHLNTIGAIFKPSCLIPSVCSTCCITKYVFKSIKL